MCASSGVENVSVQQKNPSRRNFPGSPGPRSGRCPLRPGSLRRDTEAGAGPVLAGAALWRGWRNAAAEHCHVERQSCRSQRRVNSSPLVNTQRPELPIGSCIQAVVTGVNPQQPLRLPPDLHQRHGDQNPARRCITSSGFNQHTQILSVCPAEPSWLLAWLSRHQQGCQPRSTAGSSLVEPAGLKAQLGFQILGEFGGLARQRTRPGEETDRSPGRPFPKMGRPPLGKSLFP